MRSRPLSIVFIAFVLMATPPILVLIQLLRTNGDWLRILSSVDWMWATLAALAFPVGWGVWRVRPLGYYSFITYSVVTLCYQFYYYFRNPEATVYFTLLLSAVFAAASSFFLQRHVSAPYFNPQLRWWERDPRYRVHLQARFEINRMGQKGTLLDISRGGCFAELESILFPGDVVELRLTVQQFDLSTRAKVIWRSSNPRGYGLMFSSLAPRQKKELHKFLDNLAETTSTLPNQGISAVS